MPTSVRDPRSIIASMLRAPSSWKAHLRNGPTMVSTAMNSLLYQSSPPGCYVISNVAFFSYPTRYWFKRQQVFCWTCWPGLPSSAQQQKRTWPTWKGGTSPPYKLLSNEVSNSSKQDFKCIRPRTNGGINLKLFFLFETLFRTPFLSRLTMNFNYAFLLS